MKLGVAFGWHVHPWETLLELVELAESLGFESAFVDGDISMLDSDRRDDVLDGWTVTTALLAKTRRIGIGSIRLVHHWNTARLAQAAASADRIAPGRLRLLISVGDRPHDERFGFTRLPVGERVRWLDETLTGLRALWRGESVHLHGEYVELNGARVQPAPRPGRIPISVAARRPRMLDLVAAHADVWDVNLPPIATHVDAAAAQLEAACSARKRDPASIARSMWIFTRVQERPDPAATRASYRRLNPWFHWIADAEIPEATVVGSARTCRARLAEIAERLDLELPVLDLSGLDAASTRLTLAGLAPKKRR